VVALVGQGGVAKLRLAIERAWRQLGLDLSEQALTE